MWQIYVHSFFYLAFLTGPQNSKSLKYWANDEPGFMTGLFYSTKILLKTLKRISLHETSKMGRMFMNMSMSPSHTDMIE